MSYKHINAADVPAGLRWDVTAESSGQMTTVAYARRRGADQSGFGDEFRREYSVTSSPPETYWQWVEDDSREVHPRGQDVDHRTPEQIAADHAARIERDRIEQEQRGWPFYAIRMACPPLESPLTLDEANVASHEAAVIWRDELARQIMAGERYPNLTVLFADLDDCRARLRLYSLPSR